jgi:hypothetical protein
MGDAKHMTRSEVEIGAARLEANQRFEAFTEAEFRVLLDLVSSRFAFARYGTEPLGPHVLWRHDVDMSPNRAVRLAAIEAERGVTATYFFLLHSPFYNALELGAVACMREIVAHGHAIGLHFDASFYTDTTGEAAFRHKLRIERRVLEDVVGVRAEAVSFHNPNVESGFSMQAKAYAGMVNAYGRSLWGRYRYISDSNGLWRLDRPEVVFSDPALTRVQVLTHPEWWTPDAMTPRARVTRAIDGRASRALAEYDAALETHGRPNVR